ncbi:MAG: Gfo/Idh/MocA family protein, partial [Bdellovibrionales bacterium]
HKKHALVEKPLWGEPGQLEKLESLARSCGVVCYTAYNHRFEPHFKRMKEVLASGVLGRIYSCRMFYGNGTARLVRESPWRDKGLGIIKDLGSHLVDTCRFWFPGTTFDFRLNYSNNFENLSPDHAILTHAGDKFHVELEMTMLMWKNHFTCDILAEKGSAHISSLCKWGPTKFSLRHRLLPSGKPREESVVLEQPDPTWAEEYKCFVDLCRSGAKTRLDHDRWIQETLSQFDKDK